MFEDNPFKGTPACCGEPFSRKTEPKAPAKKPAVGKKPKAEPKAKALPEKKITCPYCKAVNTFPKGKASRYCGECGKAYFR